MIAELMKYKHYLILLSALLLANYVLIPLQEWQAEQQVNLQLISKQSNKIQTLIQNEGSLIKELKEAKEKLSKVNEIIYMDVDEDKFKLTVQSVIEKALANGKCEIERIGFKGSTLVGASIERWFMEVRFSGDLICLTNTTRAIETLTPFVKIVDYNFNHRGLKPDVKGDFNAQINLNVWRKVLLK